MITRFVPLVSYKGFLIWKIKGISAKISLLMFWNKLTEPNIDKIDWLIEIIQWILQSWGHNYSLKWSS